MRGGKSSKSIRGGGHPANRGQRRGGKLKEADIHTDFSIEASGAAPSAPGGPRETLPLRFTARGTWQKESFSANRSPNCAPWLKTFPIESPAGTPGSLEDLISPWSRIDINFAQLIEILDRYGVQPEELRRTGVSGDMLRKIIEESHVMGRTLLVEQEISAINAVADKLNGSQGRSTV